ncbi:YrdB family protein [Paenibacillus beijingensis]|uniref:YrdB family protein n=1 Tax=Paenibacillus beijingensis TaxID=1126833 RepID=UPI0006989517|nr:YrdB family protein [Paenibacillus beijingensis]
MRKIVKENEVFQLVIVQSGLLAVLFLLELSALAAFGYWGFQTGNGQLLKIVLGIGTPLLVAVFWGMVVSPKASFPVPVPVRSLLQLLVFSLAALALYASARQTLAVAFLIVAVIDVVLVYLWKL